MPVSLRVGSTGTGRRLRSTGRDAVTASAGTVAAGVRAGSVRMATESRLVRAAEGGGGSRLGRADVAQPAAQGAAGRLQLEAGGGQAGRLSVRECIQGFAGRRVVRLGGLPSVAGALPVAGDLHRVRVVGDQSPGEQRVQAPASVASSRSATTSPTMSWTIAQPCPPSRTRPRVASTANRSSTARSSAPAARANVPADTSLATSASSRNRRRGAGRPTPPPWAANWTLRGVEFAAVAVEERFGCGNRVGAADQVLLRLAAEAPATT